MENLRSTYGVLGHGNHDMQYTAEVVYTEQLTKRVATLRQRSEHKTFETATLALQYATRVIKRVKRMRELEQYDEALCLCGCDKSCHRDIAGLGGCRTSLEHEGDCQCARFVWVWSPEAKKRRKAGLGVVTLQEQVAD